jgi:hypothetical protein
MTSRPHGKATPVQPTLVRSLLAGPTDVPVSVARHRLDVLRGPVFVGVRTVK